MGFEEISHTADWSVRVWADDLAGLLAESARAMNTLSGAVTGAGPRLKREIRSEGPDAESLLVTFLSELVYYQESENLGFDRITVQTFHRSNVLGFKADLEGAQLASLDKVIKAVTWHNLMIVNTVRGLETEIVFDV
jgi:SHS2 domain-containing protein